MKKDDLIIMYIKLIVLALLSIFIMTFCLFVVGVSKVDAKSYKIRLYDRSDNQVVNQDNTNPTVYNGLISSVYINYTNGNQAANNTTYFVMDTTIGIRTCLTETITGKIECIPTLDFNKIYWYDTGGTTHDITDSCNISLTKTTTNTTTNNSKLTQWRAITTCTIQSNTTLQGFLWNPKISYNAATFNNFNLNKSAVSINSFDITQDPSEGDLIISNANQNADRIIEAIRSNNQEIINQNQEIIQQNEEIILQQQATTESIQDLTDAVTSTDKPTIELPQDPFTFTGVEGIFLLPITIAQSYSTTCSPYTFQLYGKDITFPCINLENYLGSQLWGIIDVLFIFGLTIGIASLIRRVYISFTSLSDDVYFEYYGTPETYGDYQNYIKRHGGGSD